MGAEKARPLVSKEFSESAAEACSVRADLSSPAPSVLQRSLAGDLFVPFESRVHHRSHWVS